MDIIIKSTSPPSILNTSQGKVLFTMPSRIFLMVESFWTYWKFILLKKSNHLIFAEFFNF